MFIYAFLFFIEPCPRGFEGVVSECKPCSINTYEENSKCVACPDGLATSYEASTNCSTACKDGEYLNANDTCSKCPYGRYQPLTRHSQTECLYCPDGKMTVVEGAVSVDDCIVGKGSYLVYEGEHFYLEYYYFCSHYSPSLSVD